MVWVVAGSRDAVGSSRSRISGSSASVRARQRRCCCPPESIEAGSRRRELTSCQSPTSVRLRSIRSRHSEAGKAVASWGAGCWASGRPCPRGGAGRRVRPLPCVRHRSGGVRRLTGVRPRRTSGSRAGIRSGGSGRGGRLFSPIRSARAGRLCPRPGCPE